MGTTLFGRRLGLALLVATPFALPTQASAHKAEPSANAGPAVDTTRCASVGPWRCSPRQRLVLRGHELGDVRSIAFIGRSGGRDDRFAEAQNPSKRRVVVTVPSGARSGLLRIRTSDSTTKTATPLRLLKTRRSSESKNLRGVKPTTAVGAQSEVFPIAGKHDMGQSATNDFGGARNHGGQDMFAACGTPLVASVSGTVQAKGYHSAAGNYIVLQDARERSHVYMHMGSSAPFKQGDTVTAGDAVGTVGETGRASGCHLHFELWTAPGWYSGGKAIDPLPQLREWEAREHSHG